MAKLDNDADMDRIREMIKTLKGYEFTDREIAAAIAHKTPYTITAWRNGSVQTYKKNEEALSLVLDLIETLVAGFGENHSPLRLRRFFQTEQIKLGNLTPNQYFYREGLTAREELMMVAKEYSAKPTKSRPSY